MKHVVFFDDKCPLCHSAVRKLLALDRRKEFLFAPLRGETAKKHLSLKLEDPLDTLILLEHYKAPKEKALIKGKAVLRIAYHLGGFYRIVGLLSYLPSPFFDLFYRLVAKNRFSLFKKGPPLEKGACKERFLP